MFYFDLLRGEGFSIEGVIEEYLKSAFIFISMLSVPSYHESNINGICSEIVDSLALKCNKFVHLTFGSTFSFGVARYFTPKPHYNQNTNDKGVKFL